MDYKASYYVPPYFTGIFGHKIDYTLSPFIHNKMAKICIGKSAAAPLLCYGKFDVVPDKFPEAFIGFKALGLKGANITQPYKTEVLKYLDSLENEAGLIGAVNTVNREDDFTYRGYNTDIAGFLKSIEYEFDTGVRGKKVIVLGAGGASRAVLYGLIKENAGEILIVNRDIQRAGELAGEVQKWKIKSKNISGPVFYSDYNLARFKKSFKYCDIIINCVPPSKSSLSLIRTLPLDYIGEKAFAMDISYNFTRKEISFLGLLKTRVKKCSDGLSMLLFQAIESFSIWTGKRVDFEIIKAELK